MFENLRRRDHVEVLCRKACVLKFALKHLKALRAHVLHRVFRNVEAVRVPAILARGLKQVAGAAADIEQTICLPVWRKLSRDLFESRLYEGWR